MKLHLCCGDVYLHGFVNCDISGSFADPDAALHIATDLEHYYRNRAVGEHRAMWIDRRLDVARFPWGFTPESIDEIVMINSIEHFQPAVAQQIIDETWKILKVNGKLLIDFPDLRKTMDEYYGVNPEFCMRHIYGSYRDAYAVHRWGYTQETFRKLLGERWSVVFRPIVKHDYPMIGCEAVKLGAKP